MTWSIVTHDAATGAFAIAVATRNLAVGATVPHLRAGVGAVATQSISNRYLGPAVLDGMERGLAPDAPIAARRSASRGRPSWLGAGSNGAMTTHSASVVSLA